MKYEIVLTAFPFDDFTQTKIRPVLLLTNTIGEYRHIVAAFISSQFEKATGYYDIELSETESQFYQTGLRTSSIIKLHRLITIPEKFIFRSLGSLPDEAKLIVAKKLKLLFDI